MPPYDGGLITSHTILSCQTLGYTGMRRENQFMTDLKSGLPMNTDTSPKIIKLIFLPNIKLEVGLQQDDSFTRNHKMVLSK